MTEDIKFKRQFRVGFILFFVDLSGLALIDVTDELFNQRLI